MFCANCSSECVKQCDWCKKVFCRTHYYQHDKKTNITPLVPPNNPQPFQPYNPFNPNTPFFPPNGPQPFRPHPDVSHRRINYDDKLRRQCSTHSSGITLI